MLGRPGWIALVLPHDFQGYLLLTAPGYVPTEYHFLGPLTARTTDCLGAVSDGVRLELLGADAIGWVQMNGLMVRNDDGALTTDASGTAGLVSLVLARAPLCYRPAMAMPRPTCSSLLSALAALALFACTGARRPPAPPPNAAQPGAPDCIPIEGDPSGLYWDAPSQALLIADSKGGRILKWTEAGGVVPFVVLPDTAQGGGLGQIVRSADGDLLVALLGTSSAGGVVRITPSGQTSIVAELAPERRRIGLAVAADGRVFDTWFTRDEAHEGDGGVSELDLDGGETDLALGLKKPVGVLAVGDTLFVSDQQQGKLLQAPLADPAKLTAFASVEQPDLLAAGPDGAIFAGSRKGGVQRIERSGAVSLALPSAAHIRGVAYDPDKRRLFAAEHDGSKADGVAHALCIMGLPARE